MKVAFWSNIRGKSCVTSNLACISVLSALANPGDGKTILLENHQNLMNLGSFLSNQESNSKVEEKSAYGVSYGFSSLLCLLEQGRDLSEESCYRFSLHFLGNRLWYFPIEDIRNSEFLEYRLQRNCIKTMKCLERQDNLVMVDTSSAALPSSRKILREADVVVVNFTQNQQAMSHFFRNYTDVQKKAFYLVSNYDENSDLSKEEIVSRFRIPGNQIGTIPHSSGFADAVSEGRLIPFLLKNYDCVPDNANC